MYQLLGLLADTHGVFDPVCAQPGKNLPAPSPGWHTLTLNCLLAQVAAAVLKGSQTIVHAGDVGHHGGHRGEGVVVQAGCGGGCSAGSTSCRGLCQTCGGGFVQEGTAHSGYGHRHYLFAQALPTDMAVSRWVIKVVTRQTMQAPNHYLYAAAEVLKAYAEATAAPLLAVSGNVDDVPGTAQLLPPHRVLEVAGWKLLLVHIVAPSLQSKGAQLAPTAMNGLHRLFSVQHLLHRFAVFVSPSQSY